ncbi:Guanylate cyclase 32E,Guanylate cyclase soluble subunit beta-2,Head-specific guanylate cyclase,Retinal guanylyl cyclase 2,Heat-stable enterotoxin receptor,Olfactory guanylyl cyclase GC-D,Atrial natriuretic peptide receptor 2,Receptor-type guanylate cyclase gcy-28,Speract receptor,Receptor-type guanylate cyclase gcy-13,Soluble guanylate cyclase gcy-31,Soluble guanylate cyclase gcy-36,Receptor-type guanylate cyclase gcy-21,Soluble guanylate cyclase 89Db,Soluble guanylate cyclase 88E,Guanylate cyclase 2G,Rece|uniref:Guanylate cyclase n=1 Tax=Mytilus coruscus TaxID=42192 RepID=A0A6J8DFU9_MYTCO|nr:Guanylate cyclase 32E,Guanylate cyclase soluble subunit beta-2,Head-specific guanylate cyclase,Retinal guanylyl cyclase 2,Heat-stable enterotoxin receptor,Olfactory guanylyl cyclase GC-D,Atrial natriuretic peptide receptor 2,Receptor-type guanylate cyclase gcy-28,Speract receptor,Receptor-type guanylate cyclase gcy-13,Soluble guanylate cyclase gcy-31,Soluble guanylate cyclase gcy-36,Receptor-type guanylate cyclase gcy-21,Soluble guanylate cyclase 89Db,Soluble guanylate cyclase 88E,Guanylate cycl
MLVFDGEIFKICHSPFDICSTNSSITGGANLCQYANRREYPNTYEGRDYKFYCNTTNPTPAAKMGITVWPSNGTVANTDFDITVEIQDSAGVKVATGIDATLPVMLQVAWFEDLQLFNGKAPLEDMLFQTMERLSGTDAKLSRSTYQMYIDKRAVAGEVTFTGVRLLDVHTCVKLNLTMRMPNYPHSRMPNSYNDFTMNKVFFDLYASDATKSKILFYMNGTSDGAVFLTDCIPVTEQTATGLQIVTPTNDINLKIGANFPIESNIVIQVVDAAGERVYSGSDSTLNITTTADVSVCLSDDLQTIPMSEGTATVVGSICEAHAAVTLSFDATSAVSSTALTQVQIGPVEVTNEIHLAAYYSTYDSGSSSQTGAFSDSFSQYAVEDINAGVMYPSILPGRQLTMHSYNTKNSPVVTTTAFMQMLDHAKKNPHERVRGIVGFGSNTVTKGVSSLLNLYQMPNIATNEDEFSFSEKVNISTTSLVTVDFTIDTIFFEKAKQFGITILAEVAIPKVWGATYTANAFNSSLEKIKDAGSRIVWMFVMPPVSYYFMREAIDKGMGGIDGWQWNMLGLFGWAFPWANQGPTCMGNITCSQGWVGAHCWIVGYDMTMETPVWKGLIEKHRHAFRKDYLGTVPKLPFTEILAEYSLAYDAVRMFGIAMSKLINESMTITGPRLTTEIRNVYMEKSLTGELQLNANGDRPGYIGVIVNVNPHPFSWPDHINAFPPTFGHCSRFNVCKCDEGYYGLSCQHMTCNCVNGQCYIPNTCVCENGWTGVRCEVPICGFDCGDGVCSGPDTCECNSGSVGAQCNQSIYVVTIIPIICFIIFIILLIFLIRWLLKRHHLRQALKNLDWLVKWDEVIVGDTRALSIMSTAGDDFATSAKSNMCTWRSQKCYVQKFNCDTLSVEDENLRMEVVTIRELRHNNLVQFVGACLEYPNVCLLTEVTPKGSLEDLLSNDTVKLGWDFKFSLLKDICRGMHFLHLSEIHSHGRLKTSNCLVDNRWTCKISAHCFGPPQNCCQAAKILMVLNRGLNMEMCIRKYVTEGIRFGIILSEVCTREEPYSTETGYLEPEQILQLVIDKDASGASEAKKLWYKSGGDTTKLFRPAVKNEHLPEEYAAKTGLQKLMGQCWGNQPELRPSFKNVNEKLNEIYPIKGELIDNLVNMLEKYSSNLEQIVSDRTKELVEEKRKTEQLISQMLPKKVVEDLKHGNPVEPESFECVTIFFSDIVGFTNIAKGSTPFQVVDLLNDLYTTFDAILDNYDVYKVETIGDAYMIVSGLPIRNGDLHAGEIATCSLDLMASMVGFKIRHMPGTVLQLRVGMHSGPCVAGVVGLKMPRYCLFGDTVNTASRMESSSMALRIHMSDATAQILIKLGGYHLDCRGEREVKGKGVMTTWWIDGKDGFDKELPGKDMAVSLSQHEFK